MISFEGMSRIHMCLEIYNLCSVLRLLVHVLAIYFGDVSCCLPLQNATILVVPSYHLCTMVPSQCYLMPTLCPWPIAHAKYRR